MKNNLRSFLFFLISYGLFAPSAFSLAQDVSFSGPTNFSVGNTPQSVAVGDFNGDGKQDLAVANLNGGNISILLGNGNGTFGSAANFAAGFGPNSVTVGDFNEDGRQDLAVANFSGSVSILLGTGYGSFSSPTSFPAGTRPSAVVMGDFNGDGKQDLAVANEFSNVVSILLNRSPLLSNGDGHFNSGNLTNISSGAVS